jgi:hypothetical protein
MLRYLKVYPIFIKNGINHLYKFHIIDFIYLESEKL